MTQPKVAIAITADDKTAKGLASAEKRMSGLNRQSALGLQRYVGEMDKLHARTGRSLVNTFTRVERASAGVLSAGGGMGSIVKRMTALGTVGEIAATSMGEAALSGGVLAAALGTVATGGALVVGTLAAVSYATDKAASSWAKGVLGASNLAATIGVATQKLQEFQAAGERVGVDKETSAGALGGLAKTLDDARYGQNANAAGTLALLGIKMKLNSAGQVDTAAMLPAIEAAISARGPYAARKIANNLGIGEAALPMFRQGSGALGAAMADAGRYGPVATVGDEAAARRWVRERARLGQMTERATARAGAMAANFGQGALDAAGATGANLIDGRAGTSIVKGAEAFTDSVVHRFVPAVERLATAIQGWQEGGRFDKGKIGRMARGAMPIYRALLAHGDSPAEASAWAAAAYAESSGDPHRQQPGKGKNLGYGLFQWDARRRAKFQQLMGKSIYGSSVEDQLRFRDLELAADPRARRGILAAQGEAAKADAITRLYERPLHQNRDAADRANLAGAISGVAEVHHHHHITIEDKRVRIRTSSPGAKYPAVFQQITD